MDTFDLTADAKAILLLCGPFAGSAAGPAAAALALDEYNALADWLIGQSLRPADLLTWPAGRRQPDAAAPVDADRLATLLQRGAALAFTVEKWLNSGLWVLCRSDAAYPGRLKEHLRKLAPAVLYGAGDVRLLAAGGLAVLGSRGAGAAALAFAAQVGGQCAQQGVAVITGGGPGVDDSALQAALQAGGKAVAVLPDRLAATAVSGRLRQALRAGQLALVSPCPPDAAANPSQALARNPLIYALADAALVVSCDASKGDAGAAEELRRPQPRPLYVRVAADAPKGNRELLKLGARPFPDSALPGAMATLMQGA